MKIVADKAIPFLEEVFAPYADTVRKEGRLIGRDDIGDADALIVRTRTKCDAELLDRTNVKFIATATIGFDHIDLEYCRTHGIGVATAAGCNARGVLQWVAATLVALARRFGFRPQERVLGIVGVGNVGRLVKEYAESWGFRTVCCDPPRQEREHLDFVALDKVLQQADIVTLHVPSDASTRHMINAETLAMMRNGAVLINAARGEVVDTQALVESGLDCAADVWENEPDIDSRMLAKALVATPHIAGYSLQGKANASSMVVRAVAERFSLPLTEWYPDGIERTVPRKIAWERLCATIDRYCDIAAESERLRCRPQDFEALRNGYIYREEYF
ncbi:MAG: 4-phosphoerythronate dehydrogenase [Alistipes sp.]